MASSSDDVLAWDVDPGGGGNSTDSNALSAIECLLSTYNTTSQATAPPAGLRPGDKYCGATWDGLSCWPATRAGRLAQVPCFEHLNGLYYDTTRNVTRMCFDNGTWHERSDYSNCQALISLDNQLSLIHI